MSTVTASLCCTFLSVGIFMFASADQKNITAATGQNVTLTCRAPNNKIIVVEWSRADLGEKFVLLYRDEQIDPENQHPSFKNRVDLQDRQMKDGDVSLILKNVTINDTGTYECRVFMRGTNMRKRANLDVDPISIIDLSVVDPPGQTEGDMEDGSVGLIALVFLVVSAVPVVVSSIITVFVGVVCLCVFMPCKKTRVHTSYLNVLKYRDELSYIHTEMNLDAKHSEFGSRFII